MKLSNAALARLPAGVSGPAYDRAGLRPGILHVGLGNFHRAHQAVYLDDLMAQGLARDWAVLGAGVRPADAAMRAALLAQDCLSTVIELDPARPPAARVVGAMTGFVEVAADNGPLIAAMGDPAIRIVSLTVTEGGYFIDPATGRFDPAHPEIVADAAAPGRPGTVFGAILAALRARRAAGVPPFTVMCCDNLPENGGVTRAAVTGLAALRDPAFADWVAAEVAFPDAMVDRITPATGERERAMAAALGLDDPVPVTCEPFRQWVIEDRFPAGRPPFEAAGVTFTPDVHAYERMKIRILNGGHAVIAYAGALLGHEFAHEAMADPRVAALLDRVEREEILPHVQPVPDATPEGYLGVIAARFANPAVRDTIRRLCLDGSNRQPKFILPSVRDGLAAGTPVAGLALVSALWCRYCAGRFEDGREIAPNDPDWARLTERAAAARSDPSAWLGMRAIYGDLAGAPRFAGPFAASLARIWAEGAAAAIDAHLRAP